MESLHAFFASLIALVISFTGSFHPSSSAVVAKPIATTATTSIMVDTAVTQATTTATTGQATLSNATNTFYVGDTLVRNKIGSIWLEMDEIFQTNLYLKDGDTILYYSVVNTFLNSKGEVEINSNEEKSGFPVKGVDQKTLKNLGYDYAKDKNSLYQMDSKFTVPGLDIPSARALERGLLQDSKNIYFQERDKNTGDWHFVSISNDNPKTFTNLLFGRNPWTSVIKDNPEETIKRDQGPNAWLVSIIYKNKDRIYFIVGSEKVESVSCGWWNKLYYLDIKEEKYHDTHIKYCGNKITEDLLPFVVQSDRDIYTIEYDPKVLSTLYAINFETGKEVMIYSRKNSEESLIKYCIVDNGDTRADEIVRDVTYTDGKKLKIGIYKDTGIDPCKEGYKSEKIRDDIVDLTKFQ